MPMGEAGWVGQCEVGERVQQLGRHVPSLSGVGAI